MEPGKPIVLYVGIDQHRKQLTLSVLRPKSPGVVRFDRCAGTLLAMLVY
jgi:hypothetical protein